MHPQAASLPGASGAAEQVASVPAPAPAGPCFPHADRQQGAPPAFGAMQPGTEQAGGGPSPFSMPPPPPKPAAAPLPQGLLSGSLATSSQREALTAPPSRLLSGEAAGSEDKDEYLMYLLRKGTPAAVGVTPPMGTMLIAPRPPLPPPPATAQHQHQAAPPLSLQQGSAPEVSGFRAPGPVRRPTIPCASALPSPSPASASPGRRLPRQASTSLASPCSLAPGTVPSLPGAVLGAARSGATAATDQAVPTSRYTGGSGQQGSRSGSAAGMASGTAPLVPAATLAAAAAAAASPVALAAAAAAAASPPRPAGEADAAFPSFAATRHRLGDEVAFTVRNTMIRQQVVFLEQLYDLHRAIAIQKLLMQNCPEVQQVMGEAMRLMSSVGSQHGSGSGRGSKRGQRTTPNGCGATVPGSGSDDPSSFRPDSQFAAVPQLPGEAQTAGASGDEDDGGSGDANGSGSGQNGSGGGSTSPQPGGTRGGAGPALRPAHTYMHLAHTVVPTPSGASAAPQAAWQWGMHAAALAAGQVQQAPSNGLPPVPQGPPQMAPWVGQDAGLAAVGINPHPPPHSHGAGGLAAPAPTGGKDGAAAAAAAAAPPAPLCVVPAPAAAALAPAAMPLPPSLPSMHCSHPGSMMMPPMPGGMPGGMQAGMSTGAMPVTSDPMAWWYQNYYGAAAAAASFQQAQAHAQMGGMAGMSLATAQAAAAAAVALMPPPPAGAGGCGTNLNPHTTAAGTTTKWWHDPQLTFGPPVDPEVVARRAAATAALGSREGPEVQSAPAGMQPTNTLSLPADPRQRLGGPMYSEGGGARLRGMKRKAAADADEASSGTTGHVHDGGTAAAVFKRQESLRARSARAARGTTVAAATAVGAGAQDENAAELLLAIGKQ